MNNIADQDYVQLSRLENCIINHRETITSDPGKYIEWLGDYIKIGIKLGTIIHGSNVKQTVWHIPKYEGLNEIQITVKRTDMVRVKHGDLVLLNMRFDNVYEKLMGVWHANTAFQTTRQPR